MSAHGERNEEGDRAAIGDNVDDLRSDPEISVSPGAAIFRGVEDQAAPASKIASRADPHKPINPGLRVMRKPVRCSNSSSSNNSQDSRGDTRGAGVFVAAAAAAAVPEAPAVDLHRRHPPRVK